VAKIILAIEPAGESNLRVEPVIADWYTQRRQMQTQLVFSAGYRMQPV
jgi:hypothetical protein